MEQRRTHVFVTISTATGPMSFTTLEAVQQYAYRLADAMDIKPVTVRAEAHEGCIKFTFADSIAYEPAPVYMIKDR